MGVLGFVGEAAHDDADRRRSRARGREDARNAREKYIASIRRVVGRMVKSKATLAVRGGVERRMVVSEREDADDARQGARRDSKRDGAARE